MEQTLYQWFSAAASRHANETALEVAGDRLTYRKLEALAEHLARGILADHDGWPARVGLLVGRSVLAYAGYLAVQRLGAAVVPLNPAFPAARTAAMVEAGSVDLVLTDLEPGLLPVLPVPVRRMARPPAAALGGYPALPPVPSDPDALAYILFTSGSTGSPKGVQLRHRSVSTYLRHVVKRYEPGPGSRFSQTFDLTFDLSVFDMFTAWSGGATLVVPGRDALLTPVRFVRDAAITQWFSVPSVVSPARRLRRLEPGSLPTLRWSLFCGEPLTVQQARAWQ